MATTYRPRRQPCSHCGEHVVIVESRTGALGGLLRRAPAIRLQHADFVPGRGGADQVDADCRREPLHRVHP